MEMEDGAQGWERDLGGNGGFRRVRGVPGGTRAGSGAGNRAGGGPKHCRAPGAGLPCPSRAPPHGRPVFPQAAIAHRLRCRSCSSSTAGTAPHIFSWKRSCSCTKVSPSLQNSSRSRRDGLECAEGGAFPAGLLLPYPVSNLVLDVVLLLLYLGIEATRIFFGESPRIPEAPQGVQRPGAAPKTIPRSSGCNLG